MASDTSAMLALALSLTAGQLKSLRKESKPGAEIHIPRYAVRNLIETLEANHPGLIESVRERVEYRREAG